MLEYSHAGCIGDYLKKGIRIDENQLREITVCCILGLEPFHAMQIPYKVSK